MKALIKMGVGLKAAADEDHLGDGVSATPSQQPAIHAARFRR